jgi:hypothetical protein
MLAVHEHGLTSLAERVPFYRSAPRYETAYVTVCKRPVLADLLHERTKVEAPAFPRPAEGQGRDLAGSETEFRRPR